MSTGAREAPVQVAAGGLRLPGELAIPAQAAGVVLFAHGSGSSRKSPRNRRVARELTSAGIGTLLFDLLTVEEDRDYSTRFDIPLLVTRLAAATDWLGQQATAHDLTFGYFGASTGAAAALIAAAGLGGRIGAVVSRGGRPDLAGADALRRVSAPTLLIVGGEDREVLSLNRRAYAGLTCPKALEIVPGATHLFEEPGALEQVSALAVQWFRRWLAPVAEPRAQRGKQAS
ncbi:MAG TPA: alpha/beta family hydrolase [Casimicrobiaceae bacterium]|nr:alpha/beta family hydrolase [Casimicrobiaceae bacterium]